MKKEKEINLEEVNGGLEPEEFDWQSKGYETPIKEQTKQGWAFSAIGTIEDFFKKLRNKD